MANPEKVLDSLPEVLASYDPDKKFTRADLIKEIGPQMQMAAAQWSRLKPEELTTELRKVVPMVMNRLFIMDMVDAAGIKANPEKVEADLKAAEAQMGGRERLDMFMKARGITREMMVQQEMISTFVETKVAPEIKVEDAEVAAFYKENAEEFTSDEEVRASHILVTVKEDATEAEKTAAKAKIDGILAKLKQGGDFATLAKEQSDCPSKAQGGDLNYFKRGMMVPEFDEVAFKLKKDEMSEVVKTQFGYHVIKITDHKDGGVQPLDDGLKTQIADMIRREKVQDVLQDRLAKAQEDRHLKLLF